MDETQHTTDCCRTELNAFIERYKGISLKEMNGVNLLNRFDTKYWIHCAKLTELLKSIAADYFILDIDGLRVQSYRNVYFDTSDNRFYLMHHNGQTGRIKVRKREYIESGLFFLEIKMKTNKGKTIKYRLPSTGISALLTDEEKDFLEQHSGCDGQSITGIWKNEFNRITLVSRNMDERCTIDFNIRFTSEDKKATYDNLAIVELKHDRYGQKSKLSMALKELQSYPQGFSKYCIGRALLDHHVKTNLFKAKLLKLLKFSAPAA
jgi:hypothetical protein